jgi:hypothetical protein
MKIQNMKINANTVKIRQKKVLHKVYTYFTWFIQYTVAKKTLYTRYESFLNVRNSSVE